MDNGDTVPRPVCIIRLVNMQMRIANTRELVNVHSETVQDPIFKCVKVYTPNLSHNISVKGYIDL